MRRIVDPPQTWGSVVLISLAPRDMRTADPQVLGGGQRFVSSLRVLSV